MPRVADDIQNITYKGEPVKFCTAIHASNPSDSCSTTLSVTLGLALESDRRLQNDLRVGCLEAYIIDRTYRYKVDSRLHACATEEENGVTETKKCLRNVYNAKGEPRLDAKDLDSDIINFVSYFEIFSDFRGGQGFAQTAMKGFFEAMKKLPAHFGRSNLLILSPAPIVSATEEKGGDLTKISNKEWQDILEKIIASYEKSGFKLWKRGAVDRKWTISVMGSCFLLDNSRPPLHFNDSRHWTELSERKSLNRQ
ncbi:Hypothetical predicted protein [Lecanosticta acicola]|uniref:Uncharacterized protein n=1 Tax=Lecanosticta acicola TaxID=111012 RepID=A0AAI8Z5H5_9PEZI|nr:Hypothetical predicted protein [Lecanosticta acicola]